METKKNENFERNELSLEALEAELRQMPGPAAPAELEDRLLANIPVINRTSHAWYRGRLVRAAAAVVVIVGVFVAIGKFGGSLDGSRVVWADVVRKVEQIHTLTHREKRIFTRVGEEKPLLETDVVKYCSSEYGVVEKQYDENGQLRHEFYLLKQKNEAIIVFPAAKKYIRFPLDEGTMERLNQLNPKGMVEWFRSDESRELGRKTIDGAELEGFEVTNPRMLADLTSYASHLCPVEQSVMRLWVDVKTSLPVRAEAEIVTGRGFLTGFNRLEIKAVAYDVQWAVDIEPEVFEPNIPDDYTAIDNLEPPKNE